MLISLNGTCCRSRVSRLSVGMTTEPTSSSGGGVSSRGARLYSRSCYEFLFGSEGSPQTQEEAYPQKTDHPVAPIRAV